MHAGLARHWDIKRSPIACYRGSFVAPGNAEISAGQHDAVLQRTRVDSEETPVIVESHLNIHQFRWRPSGATSTAIGRLSAGRQATRQPPLPALPCPPRCRYRLKRTRQTWSVSRCEMAEQASALRRPDAAPQVLTPPRCDVPCPPSP